VGENGGVLASGNRIKPARSASIGYQIRRKAGNQRGAGGRVMARASPDSGSGDEKSEGEVNTATSKSRDGKGLTIKRPKKIGS